MNSARPVTAAVSDNLDSVLGWLGFGKENSVPTEEEFADATLIEKINYLKENGGGSASSTGSEPLNFQNYITDISTFKADSYVLDPENSDLWRELLVGSLAMFGHKAIHNVVYTRLTDDDVDYMIVNNQRLGQTFNSFYKTDVFADGGIDTVLKTLTPETYNKLEPKLQSGINRYVSMKTGGDTAGTWLSNIFEKTELSSKTTIASVMRDTDLWITDESLRFIVCLSVSADEFMASNVSDPSYVSFIETVAQSTDATMTLINALADMGQLGTFFANEAVCTAIANNAPSMTAICYNTAGFSAMISSEIAMQKVAASQTAVDVLIEGITNAANTETVLSGIKGNLSSIETALPNIANTEQVITEVADTKINIDNTLASLRSVTSKSDILVENVKQLISSNTAMVALVTNNTSCEKLCYSAAGLNAICKNAEASTLAQPKINNYDRSVIASCLADTRFFTASTTVTKSASVMGSYRELVSISGVSAIFDIVYMSGSSNAGYYPRIIVSSNGVDIAACGASTINSMHAFGFRGIVGGLSGGYSYGSGGYPVNGDFKYIQYTAK